MNDYSRVIRNVTKTMSCIPVPMPLSWFCVQRTSVTLVIGLSWILRCHILPLKVTMVKIE
jgi:uncharacterized membrane protein